MGIKDWFLQLRYGKNWEKSLFPPLIAKKCLNCSFRTHRFSSTLDCFYFWLPREIGDRIGRTGSPEEQQKKREAYGKLWVEGQYAVDLGSGRKVAVPIETGGYYDDYKATECPVCDTPYSDWPEVHVVCKKCGRNVNVFGAEHLSLHCPSCGSIHHKEGVALEPLP